MSQPNFYDDATYEKLLSRIGNVTAETAPEWGSMDAAQMCAHCAEIAEVAEGKELAGTPWMARLLKGLIRKMVVSDKPYPRGSKTHPQYVVVSGVDFDQERDRLLGVLARLKATGAEGAPSHPLFGEMSAAEKGWAAYKHLDHHLTQFGV